MWEKYKHAPIQVKAAVAYLGANVLQKGLGVVTSPIFTRILTQEEYGQVSVYLSWVSLIGVVAMFSLSMGVFNNGMLDFKHDRDTFSFSTLTLANTITVVCFALMLPFRNLAVEKLGFDTFLIALMFLYFFFEPAREMWTTRQRFEYKYKLSTVVNITIAFLSPIASILCVILWKTQAPVISRLVGSQGIFIIAGIILYVILLIKAKGKICLKYWKYAFTFNIALLPHYLSMYVLNVSDRLMISAIKGDEEAALYSIAYTIAYTITIIWSAINSSITPYIYEKCEVKGYYSIEKTLKPLLLIYAALCFCLISLAPEAIKVLATDEYAQSVYVVPPIVGGVFFLALYHVFATIIYFYKKPKYVMVSSVMAAILNVGLNYLLIPRYGFVAAGYTTLISYIIQAVLDYFFMRKVSNANVFSPKLIVFLCVGILISTGCAPLIYKFTYVRYMILFAIVAIGIVKRKWLKKQIVELRRED